VKLRRILSPHAELSSTSKTSAALTALLARLLLSVGPGPSSSSGLGGRLSALANCHSPSAGGENGLAPGDARIGDPVGVCWIELARLLAAATVSRCGGVGARARPARPPCVFVSAGVNSELPLGEWCGARFALVMSSSSMKISGTVNCGIDSIRPWLFCSLERRNLRAQ
jgi:hypothetical protein